MKKNNFKDASVVIEPEDDVDREGDDGQRTSLTTPVYKSTAVRQSTW